MRNFDIVFQKLDQLVQEDTRENEATARELDEIEELRRFAADVKEPEPVSLTTTA